jgi:uncharacterized protein (DUF433 family)
VAELIDTPLDRIVARIESNPKVLGGKPVIRGTRISVSLILNFVANGMTFHEILAEYPQLNEDDLKAALFYAERVADGEGILDATSP